MPEGEEPPRKLLYVEYTMSEFNRVKIYLLYFHGSPTSFQLLSAARLDELTYLESPPPQVFLKNLPQCKQMAILTFQTFSVDPLMPDFVFEATDNLRRVNEAEYNRMQELHQSYFSGDALTNTVNNIDNAPQIIKKTILLQGYWNAFYTHWQRMDMNENDTLSEKIYLGMVQNYITFNGCFSEGESFTSHNNYSTQLNVNGSAPYMMHGQFLVPTTTHLNEEEIKDRACDAVTPFLHFFKGKWRMIMLNLIYSQEASGTGTNGNIETLIIQRLVSLVDSLRIDTDIKTLFLIAVINGMRSQDVPIEAMHQVERTTPSEVTEDDNTFKSIWTNKFNPLNDDNKNDAVSVLTDHTPPLDRNTGAPALDEMSREDDDSSLDNILARLPPTTELKNNILGHFSASPTTERMFGQMMDQNT